MITIRRNDNRLDGRNWHVDPLELLCLHGEKWAGWGEAEKAQARRELLDAIRDGKETTLGYHGMYLRVWPSGSRWGELVLETCDAIGDIVGVRGDQEYVYSVASEGDAVEYDRALDPETMPEPHDIGRWLLEATGLFVDEHLVDAAIDDLLAWYDMDELERWCEREARATSGMRGPGAHFLHAFWERVRRRRAA